MDTSENRRTLFLKVELSPGVVEGAHVGHLEDEGVPHAAAEVPVEHLVDGSVRGEDKVGASHLVFTE